MTDSNHALPPSEQLRLGRLVFDGADVSTLAERHGLSVDEVHDAWAFCREQLSLHFAKASGETFRLLDDGELHERSLETIRLLLDWRASALDFMRINELDTPPADAIDEPDSESAIAEAPID